MDQTRSGLPLGSTKEECESAARKFFNQSRYDFAARWFRHAGLDIEAAISQAYHAREQAKAKVGAGRDAAFIDAAYAFMDVARKMLGSDLEPYYKLCRMAAECFDSGKNHELSARQYYLAHDFTKAAQKFADAKLFDETVNVIQNHNGEIDGFFKELLLNMCKYNYLQKRQIKCVTNVHSFSYLFTFP